MSEVAVRMQYAHLARNTMADDTRLCAEPASSLQCSNYQSRIQLSKNLKCAEVHAREEHRERAKSAIYRSVPPEMRGLRPCLMIPKRHEATAQCRRLPGSHGCFYFKKPLGASAIAFVGSTTGETIRHHPGKTEDRGPFGTVCGPLLYDFWPVDRDATNVCLNLEVCGYQHLMKI